MRGSVAAIVASLIAGCGEEGRSGPPGPPGETGPQGEAGQPGLDGLPGENLSITKANMYMTEEVVEYPPFEVTARCLDLDDVLLNGGCRAGTDAGETTTPELEFNPVWADDPTAPAGWWCRWAAASDDSVFLRARAVCMVVE